MARCLQVGVEVKAGVGEGVSSDQHIPAFTGPANRHVTSAFGVEGVAVLQTQPPGQVAVVAELENISGDFVFLYFSLDRT